MSHTIWFSPLPISIITPLPAVVLFIQRLPAVGLGSQLSRRVMVYLFVWEWARLPLSPKSFTYDDVGRSGREVKLCTRVRSEVLVW